MGGSHCGLPCRSAWECRGGRTPWAAGVGRWTVSTRPPSTSSVPSRQVRTLPSKPHPPSHPPPPPPLPSPPHFPPPPSHSNPSQVGARAGGRAPGCRGDGVGDLILLQVPQRHLLPIVRLARAAPAPHQLRPPSPRPLQLLLCPRGQVHGQVSQTTPTPFGRVATEPHLRPSETVRRMAVPFTSSACSCSIMIPSCVPSSTRTKWPLTPTSSPG